MVGRIGIVTILALIVIAFLSVRAGNPMDIWFTPDQQGRLAVEKKDWAKAAALFEDPMWSGIASYSGRNFPAAADSFGRIPSAVGFYNRGNAFMKGFDYAKAIGAYEQAVADAPDWNEAIENLELATYTLQYIQDTREASDTGDESELGADGYKFDNTEDRGEDMTITNESTMDLAAEEKWMRSVDTETRDFLRSRFELEINRAEAQ
jgi:Ca-activated chloride channel family protein